MRVLYHPKCHLDLRSFGVNVPIEDARASQTFELLQKKYPELTLTALEQSDLFSREDLARVHSPEYLELFFNDQKFSELIKVVYEGYVIGDLKPATILRDKMLHQGSLVHQAAREALQNKDWSYALAGGMHHAMSFGGRGFCFFHDVAVSIRKWQAQKIIKTAWIIDLDAHKGDGQAEIFQSDRTVRTLSIHMKKGWPLICGQGPWQIGSDVDIEIDQGEESQYLQRLQEGLFALDEISFERPGICYVISGADPYEKDALEGTHLLNLSKEQMLARDQLVFEFLKHRHIPQVYCLAGGYGDETYQIYYQFIDFLLGQ